MNKPELLIAVKNNSWVSTVYSINDFVIGMLCQKVYVDAYVTLEYLY